MEERKQLCAFKKPLQKVILELKENIIVLGSLKNSFKKVIYLDERVSLNLLDQAVAKKYINLFENAYSKKDATVYETCDFVADLIENDDTQTLLQISKSLLQSAENNKTIINVIYDITSTRIAKNVSPYYNLTNSANNLCSTLIDYAKTNIAVANDILVYINYLETNYNINNSLLNNDDLEKQSDI